MVAKINKILLIFAFSAVMFSIFYPIPAFALNCNGNFCLNDAFNTGGNETIQVCAAFSNPLKWFNFWYGSAGPLNLTSNITVTGGNGIISATYTNNTAYSDASGITNTTPCVNFVLSGLSAPFTTATTMINVTILNNTNYLSANPQNRTMFTINYVVINTTTAGGSVLPNTVFMNYNNATKAFINQDQLSSGPAASDSIGYWAEDCMGVVNNGACLPEFAGPPPNNCIIHGIPFPASPGHGPNCQINSTTSLLGFDFISSNRSAVTNVTPSTAANLVLNTPSAVGFVIPFNFNIVSGGGPTSPLNLTSVNVTDSSGNLVYQALSQSVGMSPFFINSNQVYNIGLNIQSVGSFVYPFMTPSAGMTGADISIPNSSISQFTTFVGMVVNESSCNGVPCSVPGAVVYAQMFQGGGGYDGIQFVNSSTTDANGKFSITVPTTQQVSCSGNCGPSGTYANPIYQFFIISNVTSNNVPMYFPTVDANSNRGYFAQPAGGMAILPPLVLKAGGQLNVNTTLNGIGMVMSELNKFITLGTGLSRTDATGKYSMVSLFSNVNSPSSMIISLLSPVTGNINAAVDLFGKNQSFGGGGPGSSNPVTGICFNNSASVSQGVITPINCNLTQPGYLNLSVTTCTDIFNPTSCSQENLNNFGFWFETNGLLRDSNGNPVAYLSQKGSLLQDLIGFGGSANNITIPLPPGTYTGELVPAFDFSRFIDVLNGTPIVISAGQITNLRIVRANAWNVQPMFNPSLILSANNQLNVSVIGPNGPLNNSFVSLNGSTVLLLNRSAATSQKISFGYDSVKNVFWNSSFNPSALGLNPGKYLLLLNATNTTASGDRFTTTMLVPINAYDFQVGLDTGGFTFGAGQIVSGKIFAFNSTGPVASNTSAVTVQMFDQSGAVVNTSITPSAIVNGQGSVNITMPNALGFYEIIATVNNSAKYGVADNWIQVSNLNIKSTVDKESYQPNDTVSLTVQVLNSSTNSPISGSSVQVSVDNVNTPAIGTTDSNGNAAITLSPITFGTNGQWTFGFHNLQISISSSTATNVIKLNTYYGFNVRGMNLFIRSDKPTYSVGDNVTLYVSGPLQGTTVTAVLVDSTSLISSTCDPISGQYCTSFVSAGFGSIKIGNWSIGHHNVKVTMQINTGSQDFFTGFDVNSFNILSTTDKFSYNLYDNITLTTRVIALNGSALSGQNIVATLYKAEPPNDINVTQASGTTNSTGYVSLQLNASQPGSSYLKINVSGQVQIVGVQISSVKVTLLDSNNNIVTNYNTAPGSTVNIFVNATSGGSNVADNSQVKARIWAFGNPIDLPSNTTTSGNSTISFTIPSFAPVQVYGLEVRVTSPSGDQGFAGGSLTVTGGNALQLTVKSDRSFIQPYAPAGSATFTSALTYPNGTAASGYNITFEIGSSSAQSQTMGSAVTTSNGLATLTTTVPTADGSYFLHAYIFNSSNIQGYSGFVVSSLSVNVTTDNSVYAPGQNISLTITVTNRTSGSQINATNGFVGIFNKNNGQIQQTVNTNGAQPYQMNITIANDSSAVGAYPIGVAMFVNQSQGFGFALVNVRNSSSSLNLTLPSSITAGTSFLANISASSGSVASLNIFSPGASNLVYQNTSISLSGTPAVASLNLTLNNPGFYVFNGFVSGIGGVTQIVSVLPPSVGTVPQVWTGTSTSANITTFTTSQDVYALSNSANSTATILTLDTSTNTTVSYSLPLDLTSGSNYYGIFAHANLVSGRKYFVRLDTSTASGLSTSMFSVS